MQLQFKASAHIAVEELVAHLAGLLGDQVRQHGDHAAAAQAQHGDDLIVIAGVDVHVFPHQVGNGRNLGDIAAGFLDGGNVGVLGQHRSGSRLDIAAGAAGHIVEDQGLGRSIRNGGKALNQAALGGLVVVRGNHQQAIVVQLAGILGHGDGVGGIVRAGAGDGGHPAGDALDGVAQNFLMLRVVEGRSFAGGAGDHKGINALLDLPIDELAKSFIVYTRSSGRGDQRGSGALKNRILSHNIISFSL